MADRPKTLLIGLDAACWEYLEPLLKEGALPNLEGLLAKGTHGSLRSTMPPITPVAWSSLITGVNPGKHGVFEWVRRRRNSYSYTPVTASNRVGTPIWMRLNNAGIRVGAANLPLTYPPSPIDGFMLCGFSTPSTARELTFPAQLLQDIENEFGTYEPEVETQVNQESPQRVYQITRDHQLRLVEITSVLAKKHDVDVLIINLMLLDHSNHLMPSMAMVQQAIVDCDADLGRLLAEFSPDNAIIISDHGSRRVKGTFLLGAWLADHEFVTRVPRPVNQRNGVVNYLLQQWMNGGTGLPARGRRWLLSQSLIRFPNLLTQPLWRAIERDIPLATMQARTIDEINPSESAVYIPGGQRGNLRINLTGREPAGVIPTGERSQLLDEVTAALRGIRDPDTGTPIFSEFYYPEQLYSEDFIELAPDLIGDYYRSDWSIRTRLPGLGRRRARYFLTSERWYGDHSPDGIYILSGSSFKSDPERNQANLLDIPATLLYLYDVPQPADFDGHPMVQAFADTSRPVRYQPGDKRYLAQENYDYTDSEEQQLLGRLSQLGYVDS